MNKPVVLSNGVKQSTAKVVQQFIPRISTTEAPPTIVPTTEAPRHSITEAPRQSITEPLYTRASTTTRLSTTNDRILVDQREIAEAKRIAKELKLKEKPQVPVRNPNANVLH